MQSASESERRRLEALKNPSENELIAADLLRLASDLHATMNADFRDRNHRMLGVATELITLARKVERLPSAYRGLKEPTGEVSKDSTQSQTTPVIRMVERSQDVPYETQYPISKRSHHTENVTDISIENTG